MPVLRIWKKYKSSSSINGTIIEDRISFDSKEDGRAFIAAVQGPAQAVLDWELISYEWALVSLDKDSQFVHENPTGGALGEVSRDKAR